MCLRIVFGDLMRQSLQHQIMAEQSKLSCTHDTLSVLGHANAVIVVNILFQRITKYILYRFNIKVGLHFASNNLQYSPSHLLETLYYALCVRLSLEMFCFEPDVGLIQYFSQ